jgi:hypothetical protein
MDKFNEQCQDKLVRVLRRVIARTENTPVVVEPFVALRLVSVLHAMFYHRYWMVGINE